MIRYHNEQIGQIEKKMNVQITISKIFLYKDKIYQISISITVMEVWRNLKKSNIKKHE